MVDGIPILCASKHEDFSILLFGTPKPRDLNIIVVKANHLAHTSIRKSYKVTGGV